MPTESEKIAVIIRAFDLQVLEFGCIMFLPTYAEACEYLARRKGQR